MSTINDLSSVCTFQEAVCLVRDDVISLNRTSYTHAHALQEEEEDKKEEEEEEPKPKEVEAVAAKKGSKDKTKKKKEPVGGKKGAKTPTAEEQEADTELSSFEDEDDEDKDPSKTGERKVKKKRGGARQGEGVRKIRYTEFHQGMDGKSLLAAEDDGKQLCISTGHVWVTLSLHVTMAYQRGVIFQLWML